MNKKGLFITFEGIDGSGKSTQIELLANYLKKRNIDFILTRDPGGTDLGNCLRDILLNYKGKIFPTCELFLYLADRAQHIEEKIIPALNSGKVVLCDRFTDSTIAYQGYARGLDTTVINELNSIVTQGLKPDITLLYDISVETSLSRVGTKKDRLESENADFHEQVRNGYLKLAEKYPERIKIIDANRDVQSAFADTIKLLEKLVDSPDLTKKLD